MNLDPAKCRTDDEAFFTSLIIILTQCNSCQEFYSKQLNELKENLTTCQEKLLEAKHAPEVQKFFYKNVCIDEKY